MKNIYIVTINSNSTYDDIHHVMGSFSSYHEAKQVITNFLNNWPSDKIIDEYSREGHWIIFTEAHTFEIIKEVAAA